MATILAERTAEEILAIPPGIVTYEDYAQLPEGAPYQLIEGELVMAPAPIPDHQSVVLDLARALQEFVLARKLGRVLIAPIDVYLGPRNTPQPDVIFITRERLHIVGDKKIEGAPDIVIEVLSPGTAYYDLRKKKRIYEAAGVREYWIVDLLEKSIEVFVLENNAYTLFHRVEIEGGVKSKVLPQFALDLKNVFIPWDD